MTVLTVPDEVTSGDPEPDMLLARVVRGVAGGVFAGAVFALVTVWFSTSQGGSADMPLLMMSTVATGSDSIASGARRRRPPASSCTSGCRRCSA